MFMKETNFLRTAIISEKELEGMRPLMKSTVSCRGRAKTKIATPNKLQCGASYTSP